MVYELFKKRKLMKTKILVLLTILTIKVSGQGLVSPVWMNATEEDIVSYCTEVGLISCYTFDGLTWTKSGDVGDAPYDLADYNSKLYVSCSSPDGVYVFDGSTWSKSGDVGSGARGLAVYDGNLYVSCYGSDDVYVFNGSTWTKSGDVGTSPQGLAVYDDSLYVVCSGSNDVYVYDGSTWTKSGDVGNSPYSLAVYNDNLYVSNGGFSDIHVYDGSTWTKSGDVGNSPRDLAVYDGSLYVACSGSDSVYVFNGSTWSKSGKVEDAPHGLTTYNGKLYVSCSSSDDVYVFNGSTWSKSGDVGDSPYSLATYNGSLYVACYLDNDVYVFNDSLDQYGSNEPIKPVYAEYLPDSGILGGTYKFEKDTINLDQVFSYNDFTYSMWAYKIGDAIYDVTGTLISRYSSSSSPNEKSFYLRWEDSDFVGRSDSLMFALYDGSVAGFGTEYLIHSDTSLNHQQWYHIVASVGDSMKLYIDGELSNTGAAPDTINYYNNTFNIGGVNKSTTRPDLLFNGYIDELRVYNRELTESEIQCLYNEGFGITCPK
jgi:hypothetical protein